MPGGFLLQDDAGQAALNDFDSWFEQQKRQIAAAAQPAVQAAASAGQQVTDQGQQALNDFDTWFAQQQAKINQRLVPEPQPVQSQPAPAAAPAPELTGTSSPQLSPSQIPDPSGALKQFDDWFRSVTQPQPQQQQGTGTTALPHAEEPATPTDVGVTPSASAGPDLGKNWKTQFDFGATYTGDYRTGTPHRGVDLVPSNGGGIGTEVDAFTPGTVTNVFRDPGGAGGLIVYVQDADGLTHAYMHLKSANVKIGDQVQRGTPIAQMGESGTEGSPHLHYEVRKNASNGDPLNQLIDPRPYETGAKQPSGALAGTANPAIAATAPATSSTDLGPIDSSSPQAFARSAAPYAAYAAKQLGLDPSWIVAMMASESNYGKAGGNELFGVKGSGNAGSASMATHEGEYGGVATNADFAQYKTPLDSVNAWIDLIKNRYKGAVNASDLPTFIHGLKSGGYFTAAEPEYLGIVSSIANNLGGTVNQTLSTAGNAVTSAGQSALDAATRTSTDVANQAGELVNQGKTALQQANDQLNASMQALQKQLDDQAKANEQWRQQMQANLDAARQQLSSSFDQGVQTARPGFDALNNYARPALESPVGQAVGSVAGPAADFVSRSLTGSTPSEIRDSVLGLPDNLGRLGAGLEAANTEAQRQASEQNPIGAGLNLAQELTGRQLPSGLTEAASAAPMPPGAQAPDISGPLSAFLKSSNVVPAEQTWTLPFLGPTPVADIIGQAANFLIPTGMEERFAGGAAGAASRAADRAAFGPTQQLPPFRWAGGQIQNARQATTVATSAIGRWARSSVDDIMRELSQGPIGRFLTDESGALDVDKLRQVATSIKDNMTRVYSGTAGDFERADLGRADENALYGPGFYTTDDPRIAGGIVNPAQTGWRARFFKRDGSIDEAQGGKVFPSAQQARQAMRMEEDNLLSQYSGLDRSMLPKWDIVPASEPARVTEEGYAQSAATRAGAPTQETYDALQRNIARLEPSIATYQRALETETRPAQRAELQAKLQQAQDILARQRQQLEAADRAPGAVVRPLSVPNDLNLLDMDAPLPQAQAEAIAKRLWGPNALQDPDTAAEVASWSRPEVNGSAVYDLIRGEAGSKAAANKVLADAGLDGITHQGGGIRPMVDPDTGDNIQHQVRVLFQSGLDKSRTLAGTQAGYAPLGAAAGASTGDENQSPQERLYRAAGGAFVAGALRRQDPVIAAFEQQALRKGATAQEIAGAVNKARETAGRVFKFSGPIADAANAAFSARPTSEQVVAARQFLRGFGDKAAIQKGAPPTAQTDSNMARMHNWLLELARQGESQKDWYTNASQAIMDAAGGDKVKAEKLAQLFAIYSPGNTVSANTQMALAAWHQFLEGVPIDVGKGQLDKKATELLVDGKNWEGRKTNNFYRNLMYHIDNDVWKSMGKEDGQTGTTIDIWMMRALKYLKDVPTLGPQGQYEFAQRAIENVAKELGWRPDQVQAAIWSAFKAGTEGTALGEAGYHYGTGLAERAGRVGGDLESSGVGDQLRRVFGLFGQEGAPALPAEKGSRTLYDEAGNAIRNPKKPSEAMTENIPENAGMVSRAAAQTVSAYAAAKAWLQKLPEISWARVFEGAPARDSNGVVVNMGRQITDDEVAHLQQQLGDKVSITPTDNGAWIINHDGEFNRQPNVPGQPKTAGQWVGAPNPEFHKAVDAALESLPGDESLTRTRVRADTTTLTNDWESRPNGEDYADVINRSQRAQAFWDLAHPLAATVRGEGGDAAAAGTSAAVRDLAAGAPGPSPELPSAANVGSRLRNFLTGEGSEAGSIDPRAALRLGGAAAGVASQEGTMSEQDKSDPWGRFGRDIAGGVLGSAAPGTALALAGRNVPRYADLAAQRTPIARPFPGTPRPSMTPGQMVSAYTKQNLLSGAKTSVSNIATQLAELARQPVVAALSGREDDALTGIKMAGHAVPDAIRNFANAMATGQTTMTAGDTSKFLPFFRILSATDDFFRTLGWAMGAGQEGSRLLRENPGMVASQVLSSNQARIDAAGQRAGAMSVFGENGGTGIGAAISRFKGDLLGATPTGPGAGPRAQAYGKQALGLLVDALVPFSGVPDRIWNIGLRRTPVIGELESLARAGFHFARGDPEAARRAMGDALTQSVISAAILSNIANGNIRGPDDKEHPNGIKLNGQWYDYSSWGPWAAPIALPASIVEGVQREGNKPNPNYINAVGNASLKALSNQFYAADMIKVLNQVGEGNAMGALGQLGTSYTDRYLPASAALNQATAVWDPILRDPSNEGLRAVLERQQAKIPGVESMLPPTPVMTSGQPEQRRSAGLGELIGMQTRPVSSVQTAINQLERNGYSIPDPTRAPKEITRSGRVITLSEDEQRKVAVERGKLIDQAASELVNSSEWKTMTPNEQARALTRIMSRYDDRAANIWASITPDAEIDRRMDQASTRVAGKLQPAGSR